MRLNKRFGLGAAAVLLGLTATACGTTDSDGGSGDSSGGGECAGKIGAMGALSGPNASIVIPSINGAKLALDQFTKENTDCKIELVEFDSEGDPAKATPLASQIAGDPEFLGVIGGAFSGETRATKGIYNEAGVPMISQSATATDLTAVDVVPVFHRVVGYDEIQGAAVAKYLTDQGASKIFVVDNSEAYGEPLAATVIDGLGDAVVGTDKTQVDQTDFAATISKIESEGADAVFYAGYIAEATPLIKQIRDAGLDIPVVFPDGVYGADFPKAAGAAGNDSIVTCPCVPIDETSGFAADYEEMFGEAPGAYAAEGFDAMTIFLEALKSGATDRAAVQAFVNDYDEKGLTKQIAFDDKGDVAEENVVIWAYKVQGGKLVPEQEIKLG